MKQMVACNLEAEASLFLSLFYEDHCSRQKTLDSRKFYPKCTVYTHLMVLIRQKIHNL